MAEQQPRIGVDEWVSQYGERRRVNPLETIAKLPSWAHFLALIIIGLLFPLFTSNTYYLQVAGNIWLLATFALGLNVVVGYAGLLDLGFVAFYGVGAYTYAYLSSNFTGQHWPTVATLFFVTALTGLVGLLLGSASLRLSGDYLAIVTLGFGQLFVNLTNTLTRVSPFWMDGKTYDLTRGSNGITNLDKLDFFGFRVDTKIEEYFVLFALLLIVLLVVYHLNNSRIGRAWRAIREDELAAEAMGTPTRSLKLFAFAVGAGIAGLSGAFFAGRQGSVFPANFDVMLLIMAYAVIVVGGLGSLPGVLLGSLLLVGIEEVLRVPATASGLFYVGLVVLVASAERPSLKPSVLLRMALVTLIVFVMVAALGFAIQALWGDHHTPEALRSARTAVARAVQDWLVIPENAKGWGNRVFGFLVIVALIIARLDVVVDALSRYYATFRGAGRAKWLRGLRYVLLVPALYMLIFAWETRLSQEPSTTRLIIVGVMLVVVMIYRPHGLLGQKRVLVV